MPRLQVVVRELKIGSGLMVFNRADETRAAVPRAAEWLDAAVLCTISPDGVPVDLVVDLHVPAGGLPEAVLESGAPRHDDGTPYTGKWSTAGFSEGMEAIVSKAHPGSAIGFGMIEGRALPENPKDWSGVTFNPPRVFDIEVE